MRLEKNKVPAYHFLERKKKKKKFTGCEATIFDYSEVCMALPQPNLEK